jgi:hypothetical protein
MIQKTARASITSISTRSFVYLTTSQDGIMKGRVYNPYYNKAFTFEDEYQMVCVMDELYESLAFPQASFEWRSFNNKRANHIIRKAGVQMDEEISKLEKNEKTTFIVSVQYRENATWQGTITWVEENRTQHFRSAFEMLKLMEEAQTNGATEVVCWDEE